MAFDAEPLSPAASRGKHKESVLEVYDRGLKEVLEGKHAKAKVEVMRVLLELRTEGKLALKGWLPCLVDLLEDGEGPVRDQAREVS